MTIWSNFDLNCKNKNIFSVKDRIIQRIIYIDIYIFFFAGRIIILFVVGKTLQTFYFNSFNFNGWDSIVGDEALENFFEWNGNNQPWTIIKLL